MIKLRAKIHDANDFSVKELEKLEKAVKLLERVVNSEKFKEMVLNHTYRGQKTYVQNLGLTNEQILNKIMQGAETLQPEEDSEIDIDITIYNAGFTGRNVVGFTYPNTVRTWINRKFFSFYSLAEIAANIFHEWLHKLGFDHDYNRTARRPFSVPYAIGNMVKIIGLELLGKPVKTNNVYYRPTVWQRVKNFFARIF